MAQVPWYEAIDELTIQRARNGDMQAFAIIYEAYAKPCYNLALRISGSPAVAEDVVHDAFIKIMGRIGSFRGDAPLWSWVRQITANTTINNLARRKWWRSLEELTESAGATMPEPGALDTSGAAQHDITRLLGQLTPQARAVLLLHDLEGMTHAEIAEVFGQTESFSKSVLHRARKQLKALTEDEQ